MATIRDVAKASGVSIATVSHVLNGRTAKVSEETRDRVLAVVRELRYRPTPLEDKQRAIKTRNIGFLATDLASSPITNNQYFSRILNSVLESAALKGYSTTMFVERMWDDIGHSIRRSYDGRCDGVILLAPYHESELIKTLWERGTPMVSVGSTIHLSGVSYVDIDNVAAASELTRHLLTLGHRKIAFVGGNILSASAIERCRGFLSTMSEAGIEPENLLAVLGRGDSDEWLDRPAAVDVMGQNTPYRERIIECTGPYDNLPACATARFPDATAFLCWNDGIARTTVQWLKAQGKQVPKEVSVASFDDSSEATSEEPFLTTMRQPYHLIGRTGVNLLLDRIDDYRQPDQAVKFVAEMVVRDSTAPRR